MCHGGPEPAPLALARACYRANSHCLALRGLPRRCHVSSQRQPFGSRSAAARPLSWVASLVHRPRGPRDQGRPLSSVHHRGLRLCAASKRACERLPRQHETAAACGVSATNRQGGRVGVVYIDHAPPVWGCPGPAARPTSACSAEQRARPAATATQNCQNGAVSRPPVAPSRVLDPADELTS